MSEVDDMKKAIAEQNKQRKEADEKVTLAINTVNQTRKAKRDQSNRQD